MRKKKRENLIQFLFSLLLLISCEIADRVYKIVIFRFKTEEKSVIVLLVCIIRTSFFFICKSDWFVLFQNTAQIIDVSVVVVAVSRWNCIFKYTKTHSMRQWDRKKMISIYWEFSVKKKEKNSNEQEAKYLSKANQGDYNKGFFRCAAARVWIFEIMCLRLTFSSAPHVLTRLFHLCSFIRRISLTFFLLSFSFFYRIWERLQLVAQRSFKCANYMELSNWAEHLQAYTLMSNASVYTLYTFKYIVIIKLHQLHNALKLLWLWYY